MAKKQEQAASNLPVKVGQENAIAIPVPDYMQEFKDDLALQQQEMGEYVILPRIKLIQNTAGGELQKLWSPGSVILSPAQATITKVERGMSLDDIREVKFSFCPMYMYTEFCKWSDVNDPETYSIVDRSFDKQGRLAAISRDKNKRNEPYGSEDPVTKVKRFSYRYAEHLNFAGIIYGAHPLAGQECTFSFSRGSYGVGVKLINGLTSRKMPMWGTVWDFNTHFIDEGPQKKYWSWEFDPAEQPNIAKEHIEAHRKASYDLRDAFKNKLLSVHLDDARDEVPKVAGSTQAVEQF